MPQTFQGSGAGVVSQPHSFAGVPLLTGFRVDYEKKDRHVFTLGVSALYDTVRFFEGSDLRNTVTAKYFDNFLFDDFEFVARYHDETRPGVMVKHADGRSKGGAFTFALNFPSIDHTFALIGFNVQYDQLLGSIGTFYRPPYKDHHFGTFSIRTDDSQENLTIQFSDKNNDDAYLWDVWYAWLPNAIVERTDTISGSGDQGSVTRELRPGGVAILRGFTLTYGSLDNLRGKDHHSDEVGVLIEESNVPGEPARLDVFLNDKNDDDKFAWAVDYATLVAVATDPRVIR